MSLYMYSLVKKNATNVAYSWNRVIYPQGSHFEPATGDFPPATVTKIAGYFL